MGKIKRKPPPPISSPSRGGGGNFFVSSPFPKGRGRIKEGDGKSKQFNSGKVCPPPNSKIRGRTDLPPVLFL